MCPEQRLNSHNLKEIQNFNNFVCQQFFCAIFGMVCCINGVPETYLVTPGLFFATQPPKYPVLFVECLILYRAKGPFAPS